jgi:pyroglutamyl-peptidase
MALRSTVLVTGFDAFGGDPCNPSEVIARALHGRQVAGHRVVGAVLPTSFANALPTLRAQLTRHRPALIVGLGLAGGRTGLSFERVAINLCDARIADNAGAQPIDRPVVEHGPAAYLSTLPVKAMCEAVRAASIPAEVSYSAGTFVCNHLFYGLMHHLTVHTPDSGCRGGFVHLPWISGQGEPSLPMPALLHGLRLALRTALRTPTDSRIAGGTLH